MDLFEKSPLTDLTDLELEAYNFIIRNHDKVPYMTIRELAEEAHVSSTIIVNLCKKLGYSGFSEFKIKFKMSQKEHRPVLLTTNEHLDNFFLRAGTREFQAKLDEVSHIIHRSVNLIAIGNGRSGTLARYATAYFGAIGKLCTTLDNPFLEFNDITRLNGVALFFSVKGEMPNHINLANSLKRHNVQIITITNTPNSTLARLSDHTLCYYMPFETLPTNEIMDLTTQVPVIYIIENLVKRVYHLYE